MEKSVKEETEIDLLELYSFMRVRNVCVCKAVSEKDIIAAVESGVKDLRELSFRTGAATACGSCSSSIRAIINRELTKKNEA